MQVNYIAKNRSNTSNNFIFVGRPFKYKIDNKDIVFVVQRASKNPNGSRKDPCIVHLESGAIIGHFNKKYKKGLKHVNVGRASYKEAKKYMNYLIKLRGSDYILKYFDEIEKNNTELVEKLLKNNQI